MQTAYDEDEWMIPSLHIEKVGIIPGCVIFYWFQPPFFWP